MDKKISTLTGSIILLVIALILGGLLLLLCWDYKKTVDEMYVQKDIIEQNNIDIKENVLLFDNNGKLDTSDWITYENEKYGFIVKYPQNWEIRSEKDDGLGLGIWYSEKGKVYMYEGGKEDAIIVSVSLKDNPKLTSTNELLRKWKEYYDISTEPIMVDDDISGVYYKGYGEGIKVANIPGKNYQFSISSSIMTTPAVEVAVRPILQGMIGSVHFRDDIVEQTIDQSNWKAYKNEKYGFNLRVPPEWIVKNHAINKYGVILSFTNGDEDLLNAPGEHLEIRYLKDINDDIHKFNFSETQFSLKDFITQDDLMVTETYLIKEDYINGLPIYVVGMVGLIPQCGMIVEKEDGIYFFTSSCDTDVDKDRDNTEFQLKEAFFNEDVYPVLQTLIFENEK